MSVASALYLWYNVRQQTRRDAISHIAEISVIVKDIDALAAAAKELGLDFCRGQATYKWYGRSLGDTPLPAGLKASDLGKCDHALRIAGNAKAYEIGVKQMADGTYRLLWDFWQGGYGLQDKVGQNAGKLIQEYAAQVALKKARQQGFAVQRKMLADGRVQLVCRK